MESKDIQPPDIIDKLKRQVLYYRVAISITIFLLLIISIRACFYTVPQKNTGDSPIASETVGRSAQDQSKPDETSASEKSQKPLTTPPSIITQSNNPRLAQLQKERQRLHEKYTIYLNQLVEKAKAGDALSKEEYRIEQLKEKTDRERENCMKYYGQAGINTDECWKRQFAKLRPLNNRLYEIGKKRAAQMEAEDAKKEKFKRALQELDEKISKAMRN